VHIKYRPEIDGLRAIAVVAVILYHAQITLIGYQPFKGGFIGVDIFLVISGYLITSIILRELKETGSFSFKHFYERRIRRILPALLFVMLVSFPFAWIYLLPSSLVDFSKSILYSLGFSSNFYFHYSGQQYGDISGLLKPFLHTWSLSIEEQYYVLFPIILLITFKYFKKYLRYILIIGFIISLLLADWGSKNYESATFYFIHTRMWELLVGSILAYFEIQLGRRNKHQTLNLILPSIGLFLIGYSVLFFNDAMFHPSFYTLLPIIGVCLIIWFSGKNELITKILSSKLFVSIGLISYSLYLWHYPVFAFFRIINYTSVDAIKGLILVIVLLILSIISYYLIERPARNKKYKFKIIILSILASIIILIIVTSLVITKKGFKSRFPEVLQNNLFEQPWALLKNSKNQNCFGNKDGCIFNSSSNKKVFLIGDSHMAAIMFNLKDRIIDKNYQFLTSTLGGCLYYPGFNLITIKTQKISKECNIDYFSKLEKILNKKENSIIIFGARLPVHLSNYWFDNKEGGFEGRDWDKKYIPNGKFNSIQSSFKVSVNELSKDNKIILIYPIPEAGWKIPERIFNQFSKNLLVSKEIKLKKITTSYEVYKERAKTSFELLDSIKGENIYRVYPHTLFCNNQIKDRCITHDEKNIFYADGDHPSIKGAEMINDLIIKEIEKIEKKSN